LDQGAGSQRHLPPSISGSRAEQEKRKQEDGGKNRLAARGTEEWQTEHRRGEQKKGKNF